jgi:aspartate aminotransferase-like enzyme
MGVYEDRMIRVGVLGDVSIDDLRRVVEVVNNIVD